MNVSLTPELEKFVQDKVASGLYSTASEIIRESVRLLQDQEGYRKYQINKLNKAIELGLQQLDNGQELSADELRQFLKSELEQLRRGGRNDE